MKTWLIAVFALCVSGSAMGAQRAAADDAAHLQRISSDTGFPNYSREDETKSCLFGYDTENASILDCVARGETYRTNLSKVWSDIDDRYRKDCVSRLWHLGSYSIWTAAFNR